MAKSNQERLEELKLLRKQELESEKPSHNYVQDLDESIMRLEKQRGRPEFQMVS